MSQPLTQKAQKVIESIIIPSPPKILFDITAEMAKAEPEYSVIIDLISQDMSMTAKIIKVANSPFFALRYKAATIETALSVLGLENFKSIVLATALRDAMKGNNLSQEDFEAFYTHSMQVARVAQIIALEIGATEIFANQAFMAGLFHDCGIPLLSQKFPNYIKTIKPHVLDGESIVDLEEAFFLCNHCVIGAFVAKAWQIPEMVCHAIKTHHQESIDSDFKEHEKQIQAIMLLSEHLLFECLRDATRAEDIYNHKINIPFLNDVIIPFLDLDQQKYKSLITSIDALVLETE